MAKKYGIKRLEYNCRDCNDNFVNDFSADNEIVKLYFDDEKNPRWINMCGEWGYLSLIEKLVGKGASNQLFPRTITILENKMSDLLQKKVTFERAIRICPNCGSKDISVINELFYESEDIDIYEIEKSLFE